MKKLYIIMLLVLTGTMAMAQTSVWDGKRAIWTRGEGTEENPFLIESAQNLAYLAFVVNKGYTLEGLYFRLTTDIDLNGSEDQQWMPIGMSGLWFSEDGCVRKVQGWGFNAQNYFRGHFDGGEHSISNLYIDNTDGIFGSNIGLFGNVMGNAEGDEIEPAVVENVFVTSGYLKGSSSAGGIVGKAGRAMVSRCWNGATIEGTGSSSQEGSGGIVGMADVDLQVRKCYNKGEISGYNVAGIVGYGSADISECYNEGDITGVFAGGIYGFSQMRPVTINNCYNIGSVSAIDGPVLGSFPAGPAAGGISSFHFRGNTSISNCYNVGAVSSVKDAGCILAYGPETTLENNYYIATCDAGGEGEPMTEEYMQSQAFVDFLNSLGTGQEWVLDVNNTNGGFPILANIDLAVGESSELQFAVYPNPAQGQFVVEGTGIVRIINMMGQVVETREIDGRQTFTLSKGLYFVTLNGQTAKVVVE